MTTSVIALSLAASANANAAAAASRAHDAECRMIINAQDLSSIDAKQQYAECVLRLYPTDPVIPAKYQAPAAAGFLVLWLVCGLAVWRSVMGNELMDVLMSTVIGAALAVVLGLLFFAVTGLLSVIF